MPAHNSIDLKGRHFGRLTVMERGQLIGKIRKWRCKCDCGSIVEVSADNIIRRVAKSCGCLKREIIGALNRTHGASSTVEYKAWCKIIGRCENASSKDYPDYGGRGIRVCARWRRSFEAFLEDMGPRPANRSIDRINNGGDYDPSNCRWASAVEQANNKRTNHVLKFDGKSRTVEQWSREVGIKSNIIVHRLRRGWTIERALTEPLRRPRRIRFRDREHTITEWASEMGIHRETLQQRLDRGWPRERIFAEVAANGGRQ